MSTSIILPVLNEPGISPFLLRLHEVMSDVPGHYEILIVMGDREKLYPIIPGLPNQRVVKSYADSLDRAILLGFSHSKGNKIVVLDADGSHPIEKIPEIIRGLSKYDMVVGSRYLPGSEYDYSSFRKLVAWCFRKYAQIFGSNLSDPMSGFFGVRKELIDKVQFRPIPWKTGMEIEMKSNPRVLDIPIKFNKRQSGMSKANSKIGIKIIFNVLLDKIGSI